MATIKTGTPETCPCCGRTARWYWRGFSGKDLSPKLYGLWCDHCEDYTSETEGN